MGAKIFVFKLMISLILIAYLSITCLYLLAFYAEKNGEKHPGDFLIPIVKPISADSIIMINTVFVFSISFCLFGISIAGLFDTKKNTKT